MPPTPHPTLTSAQISWLLTGIKGTRVGKDGKGYAHVEAWDIRRHLTRAFGFGGYSTDLLAADLVKEKENARGKWSVIYRCAVRLTVKVDGSELGHWHGLATGAAINQPDPADAHDFALKTADSQAFKRAAINLGDQFGLSLYNHGSLDPVILGSLAHMNSEPPTTDPPVHPEQQPGTEPQKPDPATEKEKERKAMWDAAEKNNSTDALPGNFKDYFGHPIEQGTAEEYRQAREIMEETP